MVSLEFFPHLPDSTQTDQRTVEQAVSLTARNAFTRSGCHHMSPSSCLETIKLQKFPLPYQVFRKLACQKMGNVNQFKPTDLIGPKGELWGTTEEPFCELFCSVWNHTDLISLWVYTGFSACVLHGHLHPCSKAQMFNGLC